MFRLIHDTPLIRNVNPWMHAMAVAGAAPSRRRWRRRPRLRWLGASLVERGTFVTKAMTKRSDASSPTQIILASWNVSPTRTATVGFVELVTKEGGRDCLEPAGRIAVFDNEAESMVACPSPVEARNSSLGQHGQRISMHEIRFRPVVPSVWRRAGGTLSVTILRRWEVEGDRN
jgi:hypothetical protein